MIPLAALAGGLRGYLLSAAVGATLAAGGAWWVQGLRLDAVRADLRAAGDRIAILAEANKTCAADVKVANDAVATIKQEAEDREKAAAAAVAAAEASASKSDKVAADLAARKPTSKDDCQAAANFAADYFKGRRK